jgi:hypothetical protein
VTSECYSGFSVRCECNRNSYAKCLLRRGVIVALLPYALRECDPVGLRCECNRGGHVRCWHEALPCEGHLCC